VHHHFKKWGTCPPVHPVIDARGHSLVWCGWQEREKLLAEEQAQQRREREEAERKQRIADQRRAEEERRARVERERQLEQERQRQVEEQRRRDELEKQRLKDEQYVIIIIIVNKKFSFVNAMPRTWLQRMEENMGQPLSACQFATLDRWLWRSLRPSASQVQQWVSEWICLVMFLWPRHSSPMCQVVEPSVCFCGGQRT